MREGCSALPHFLHVVQESLGDGEGEYRRESPPPFMLMPLSPKPLLRCSWPCPLRRELELCQLCLSALGPRIGA